MKQLDSWLVTFWLWATRHPRWRATLVTTVAALALLFALSALFPSSALNPLSDNVVEPATALQQAGDGSMAPGHDYGVVSPE